MGVLIEIHRIIAHRQQYCIKRFLKRYFDQSKHYFEYLSFISEALIFIYSFHLNMFTYEFTGINIYLHVKNIDHYNFALGRT